MHRGQIQFKGREKKILNPKLFLQSPRTSRPRKWGAGDVQEKLQQDKNQADPLKAPSAPKKRGKSSEATNPHRSGVSARRGTPGVRAGGQASRKNLGPAARGAAQGAGAARPPPRPAPGRRGCPSGAGCPLPAAVYGLSPAGGVRRAPPAAGVLRAAAQGPMSRCRPAPAPRPQRGGKGGRPAACRP